MGLFFITMLDESVLELREGIVTDADPLHLDLEDDKVVEVIDSMIDASTQYYRNQNLYSRQGNNIKYYMGKHVGGEERPGSWNVPFVENVVYEGIRRVKPIATSRLPDLTIKSSNYEHARILTDLVNTDIRKRETRKLLGTAHVQERLLFYAVLKARWNPEKGSDGNYEFINVYPQNVVWDHTCKTNNADDMRFFAENTSMTLKEVMMMFPDRADDLLEHLNFKDLDKKEQEKLASEMKIWEVWFHWYKDTKDEDTGKVKWEKVNGVMWKYDDFVLGKMRNPYFDYQGRINLFTKEMQEKQGMTMEQIIMDMIEDETQGEVYYQNYFKGPRKPYYLMAYESLGKDPISTTTAIEQIIPFQDHINDQGRQIVEMNERSAGKPVFSSDALDKKTISKLDWRNYKQALVVNGEDINRVFAFAQPPAAPAPLYKSKEENRSIAFEMMGLNATTRGVRQGDQTLGEAQMFREADFGFLDDLVEETINEAAEWMAQWTMQFIKLFYTRRHFIDVVGTDGETINVAVHQDLVDDGMLAEVSASGVDKLMRKRLAIENMKLGVADILTYYEDTDQSNPKERARRAWLFNNAPQIYFQEFLAQDDEKVPGPIQEGQPPQGGEPAGIMPGQEDPLAM